MKSSLRTVMAMRHLQVSFYTALLLRCASVNSFNIYMTNCRHEIIFIINLDMKESSVSALI